MEGDIHDVALDMLGELDGIRRVLDVPCGNGALTHRLVERGYDLVLDCVGNRSTADSRRPLSPGGTYVAIGAPKAMLPIIE